MSFSCLAPARPGCGVAPLRNLVVKSHLTLVHCYLSFCSLAPLWGAVGTNKFAGRINAPQGGRATKLG